MRGQGKCKEKVEMYICYNMARAFFETFSESGLIFLKSI